MAKYTFITDIKRPQPYVIMVEFEVRDDATNPPTVLMRGSHGFQALIHDANGAAINETLNQRLARLRTEFDAYSAALLAQVSAGDAQFTQIRDAALNYRYPAAG